MHFCCLLLLAYSATLAGCITIGESAKERSLAENFSGNPHIEGSYFARGTGQWWNGRSFQKISGNLGSLFRSEGDRFGFKCDRVTFREERDGVLTVWFQLNGEPGHLLRFVPGSNYSKTAAWISLKMKRSPEGGEESEDVELLLALDNSGKLCVVERKDFIMVTGIGIPIVPVRSKSVSAYSFDPIPHP
jgi:hypothetical protein